MTTCISTQEKGYWKRSKAYRVLDLMKEGKSIAEISQDTGWKEETVWNFVCTPNFLRKFDSYLQQVYFNYRKNRILLADKALSHLYQIAMGTKVSSGISPSQAFSLLVQLLKVREKLELTSIRQANIIMGIPAFETPKSQRDLEREFGYKRLEPEEPELLE